MICKILPTSVLKMFVSKSSILLYKKLESFPVDHITEFNIFFNCKEQYKWDFEYKSDPRAIAIWYCNNSYGLTVYKCNPYNTLIGGNVTVMSAFFLSPERELFYRLAMSKISENVLKIVEKIND